MELLYYLILGSLILSITLSYFLGGNLIEGLVGWLHLAACIIIGYAVQSHLPFTLFEGVLIIAGIFLITCSIFLLQLSIADL